MVTKLKKTPVKIDKPGKLELHVHHELPLGEILATFLIVTALWLGYLSYVEYWKHNWGKMAAYRPAVMMSEPSTVAQARIIPKVNCWAPETYGGPRGCK